VQLGAFIVVAPYLAAGGRYDSVFRNQYRYVSVWWYTLFISISAYSNTGMSLVDLSMVPFQHAYLSIVIVIILIYAGNTAFPCFLRLTVWTTYKLVPTSSRIRETLKFLLDHPRRWVRHHERADPGRCFIYMFPAMQTWVLALVMLGLT